MTRDTARRPIVPQVIFMDENEEQILFLIHTTLELEYGPQYVKLCHEMLSLEEVQKLGGSKKLIFDLALQRKAILIDGAAETAAAGRQ